MKTNADQGGHAKVCHPSPVTLQNCPRDRIINIDETNWRTVAGGFMTWAHTSIGSVQRQIDNDEKDRVTVIAGMDAAVRKLPLMVIGKGKTERCVNGCQLPPEVRTYLSESGWTTKDVMCRYFTMLRQELYREGLLIVILDAYAAHRSPEVREIARLWEIQLVFIPPGCTDKLQPWIVAFSEFSSPTRGNSGHGSPAHLVVPRPLAL
jgi:hypothetical protein